MWWHYYVILYLCVMFSALMVLIKQQSFFVILPMLNHVKRLKSVYISGSYPKIKTGVPLFWTTRYNRVCILLLFSSSSALSHAVNDLGTLVGPLPHIFQLLLRLIFLASWHFPIKYYCSVFSRSSCLQKDAFHTPLCSVMNFFPRTWPILCSTFHCSILQLTCMFHINLFYSFYSVV